MSANRLFGFTGCKGTTKFADVQILSGKSFRSLMIFKGDRAQSAYSLEKDITTKA